MAELLNQGNVCSYTPLWFCSKPHAYIIAWEDYSINPFTNIQWLGTNEKKDGYLQFKVHGFSRWHLEIGNLVSYNPCFLFPLVRTMAHFFSLFP